MKTEVDQILSEQGLLVTGVRDGSGPQGTGPWDRILYIFSAPSYSRGGDTAALNGILRRLGDGMGSYELRPHREFAIGFLVGMLLIDRISLDCVVDRHDSLENEGYSGEVPVQFDCSKGILQRGVKNRLVMALYPSKCIAKQCMCAFDAGSPAFFVPNR